MAQAEITTETPTLAELLHRLGDISPDRILTRPGIGTATKEDLLALHMACKPLCELIDGVIVRKAVGYLEAFVAGTILRLIGNFASANDLGAVTGADGMLGLGVKLIRIPDVAFVSWDHHPNGKIPDDPAPEVAPDLAVEVLSRSNTRREMERKREDYFAAGTRLVWIVDHKKRTVQVYTDPETCDELSIDDTLTGGDVLPGFETPVRAIFADLDRVSK